MLLSRDKIKKLVNGNILVIQPFNTDLLKPASYTFTNKIAVEIRAKEFMIVESAEVIKFPDNIVGILSTRGSIAKMGLDCLMTDTIIEPSSEGRLSFCAINNSNQPIRLKAGTPMVKCLFYKLE